MSTVNRCEPCGKNFTGPVCYQQHLKSEKHKKKVLSSGFLNSSSGENVPAASSGTQISQFECSVCGVAFDSLRNFHTHSISPEHARKVIEKNSEYNVVSSSSDFLNFEGSSADKNVFGDENDMVLPKSEMFKSQTLSFSACNTCNKAFSGPEPYKQHIESMAHKKKVELEKNELSAKPNQILTQFSCDPCKKVFSGQVPYTQHMNSEIHRKKVVSLQLLEKNTTEVDSVSRSKEPKAAENNLQVKDIPWFCYICQKPCSGYIPYQQHLSGITHMKNVLKAEGEKSNINLEDSVKVAIQNSSEGKNIRNASFFLKCTSEQLNGKMDVDDTILPGLTDSVKVLPFDELEKSVKIILPADDISFDKYDKEINTDSVGGQNPDRFEEIQVEAHKESRINQECPRFEEIQVEAHKESRINQECPGNNCDILKVQVDETKENPDAYQVCNICNVSLKTREEALNHYESLEHYCRRWKSV